MKLYLAYKDAVTLMEGRYEEVLGVFDSEEKAWNFLKTTLNYNNSKWVKNSKERVYHLDGELAFYWYVKEVELNKGIKEFV